MPKNEELMRDTVPITFGAAVSGTLNSAFDIDIPDGYAMELHEVEFGAQLGSGAAANTYTYELLDDPDETVDPGHAAEKVIQSDTFLIQVAEGQGFTWKSKDCHKTLLVKNPNFLCVMANVPGASVTLYARIWFDFVKISKEEIIDLLKQQHY